MVLTSMVAQDAYAIARWPQAKMCLAFGVKGRGVYLVYLLLCLFGDPYGRSVVWWFKVLCSSFLYREVCGVGLEIHHHGDATGDPGLLVRGAKRRRLGRWVGG